MSYSPQLNTCTYHLQSNFFLKHQNNLATLLFLIPQMTQLYLII